MVVMMVHRLRPRHAPYVRQGSRAERQLFENRAVRPPTLADAKRMIADQSEGSSNGREGSLVEPPVA